ncbi:hypothetical protein AQJ23_01955 [Streptomyces antibioticus]|nr:PP2C family protein-serine/threonine phosphatase [Streptomyces antibioticus]KUN29551.1 hypothetical protein AQJ23_01955 [Streptomyces antibioticus]
MGDVMGHGFQAAVTMSQYRSLLRTIATNVTGVEEILEEFDRQVAQLGLERLATCLLAVVDPQDGTCTAAGAGHPPPAVLRPDGSIDILWLPAGPPIGTGLGGYEPKRRVRGRRRNPCCPPAPSRPVTAQLIL